MQDHARREHDPDGLPFRVSLEAVNKGVGVVALGLPFALLGVSALGGTCPGIDSISHYYYSRLGGDFLVGALCFIGVLLLFFYKLPVDDGRVAQVEGYRGHGLWDMRAARLAGACAFGVALAPTTGEGCEDYGGAYSRLFLGNTQGGHGVAVTGEPTFDFWATYGIDGGMLTAIHYGAALGMFLVLAYFSLFVFARPQSGAALTARGQRTDRKKTRNIFYRIFGILILVSIGALIYKFLSVQDDPARLARWNAANLTFWFEALGLVAFGCSWSMKGRLFAIFRDAEETDPKRAAA